MPDRDDFQPDDQDSDDQDQAEVFDEENITPDGRDIATSDLQRDLFDATSFPEDANDALAADDDFDPDAADEAELEEVTMAEGDLDEPRSFVRGGGADLVGDDLIQPADLEAEGLADDDIEAPGGEDDAADDTPSERALRRP
ncbi:MAG TPA: primosomal protein [Caulobacteraceae bacterium]|jgi:hypothetical protein